MNKKYKKVVKVLVWILAPFFLVWVMLHGYSSFMIQKYGCMDPNGVMDDPTTSCDGFHEKVAQYCSLDSQELALGSTGSSVVKLQLLSRSYLKWVSNGAFATPLKNYSQLSANQRESFGYLPPLAVTGVFNEEESNFLVNFQQVNNQAMNGSRLDQGTKDSLISWCKDNYQQIVKQEKRDTKQVELGKKFSLKEGETVHMETSNLNMVLLSSYEQEVKISSYKVNSDLGDLQTVDVSQNKLKVGESSSVDSYKITFVSTPSLLHRWRGAYFVITK